MRTKLGFICALVCLSARGVFAMEPENENGPIGEREALLRKIVRVEEQRRKQQDAEEKKEEQEQKIEILLDHNTPETPNMHFYTWDSLKRLLSAAHTEQLERIYSAEELADRLSELQQAGHESEQVLSNSVVSRSSQELEQQKAAYKTYVDFVVHGNLNSVQQREQIFMLHFCAALHKHEEVRVAQAEQKEEKAGLSFMNGLFARTFAAMPGIALLAIFVLGKQCF